jgi:hypothetical protein
VKDDNQGCAETPASDYVSKFIEHLRDPEMGLTTEKKFQTSNWGTEGKAAIIAALTARDAQLGDDPLGKLIKEVHAGISEESWAKMPRDFAQPNITLEEANVLLDACERLGEMIRTVRRGKA